MLGKKSSGREGSERLKDRRRRSRRRSQVLYGVLALLGLGAFVYLTWQPSVRVKEIVAEEKYIPLIKEQLAGAYLGIIPADSIFFIPKSGIRNAIFTEDPGVQAISIAREGFTGLSISLHKRVPIALWCGLVPSEVEGCYVFDAEGYIFGLAEENESPLNTFTLYDSLAGDPSEPQRATLAHAGELPALFEFARKIAELGSPVTKIAIQGDEATLSLKSSTKLVYVVGTEEASITNLVSSKEEFNLGDGSIEYADLRFPAKVYLKRKGE